MLHRDVIPFTFAQNAYLVSSSHRRTPEHGGRHQHGDSNMEFFGNSYKIGI